MRLGLQSGLIPLGFPAYNDIFVLFNFCQVCYVAARPIWLSINLIIHGEKNINYVYPHYVIFDSLLFPVA